ncbi:hypothetical protein NLX74_09710 [Paenibacillus sp. MZ03-122A]|nr:hypothetical protein [Paenibacillus sp. MZ03-122A]
MAYLILGIFMDAVPAVIAIILILANTGLTFAQITMANTISRTLSGNQTGVGMIIYMMGSFMAGLSERLFLVPYLIKEYKAKL